ncbi:heme biosynthesis HemY N-terminal domain-containing protein [Orbaceae bacterium ac157xtp]
MLRLLIIFLLLVIGIFVGPMLAGHQGLAFFQIAGYRIKMSITTFVVIELVFFLMLYIFYWLVRKLAFPTKLFNRWFKGKSPLKASKRIEQAQWLLLMGDYRKASKLLSKSAKASKNITLTYLQAAQAQINHSQFIEARKSLELAAKHCKKHEKLAFKLVQLRLLIKSNEFESAKLVVNQLIAEHPHNPEVLRLADTLYYRLEDYQSIITLLPAMYKAEAFDESQLDQFKNVAYLKRMEQLAISEGWDGLSTWWNKQPRSVKNNNIYKKALSIYQDKLLPST